MKTNPKHTNTTLNPYEKCILNSHIGGKVDEKASTQFKNGLKILWNPWDIECHGPGWERARVSCAVPQLTACSPLTWSSPSSPVVFNNTWCHNISNKLYLYITHNGKLAGLAKLFSDVGVAPTRRTSGGSRSAVWKLYENSPIKIQSNGCYWECLA